MNTLELAKKVRAFYGDDATKWCKGWGDGGYYPPKEGPKRACLIHALVSVSPEGIDNIEFSLFCKEISETAGVPNPSGSGLTLGGWQDKSTFPEVMAVLDKTIERLSQ